MSDDRARLNEIRKQVLGDVTELIKTTAIVEPLIQEGIHWMPADRVDVAKFLRMQLSRHVILILLRLHDRPQKGRHGEIASIEALLHEIGQCNLFHSNASDTFNAKRLELRNDMEGKGVTFAELRLFRNAEIAHSLHTLKGTYSDFMYWIVGEFAHDTFELCHAIERDMVRAGLPLIVDLDAEFHFWRTRGGSFWGEPPEDDDGITSM